MDNRYKIAWIKQVSGLSAATQRKELLGIGVDENSMYEHPTHLLDDAIKACRPGDIFVVASTAVLGRHMAHAMAKCKEQGVDIMRAMAGELLPCRDGDKIKSADDERRRNQTAAATKARLQSKNKPGRKPKAKSKDDIEYMQDLSQQGLSFAEIGEKLGISISTVSRRLAGK